MNTSSCKIIPISFNHSCYMMISNSKGSVAFGSNKMARAGTLSEMSIEIAAVPLTILWQQ